MVSNVYIGNKVPNIYILAVISQVERGETEINLMARGRAISSAVDVLELLKSKYLKDRVSVLGTDFYTEDIGEADITYKVSVISIKINIGELDG